LGSIRSILNEIQNLAKIEKKEKLFRFLQLLTEMRKPEVEKKHIF